MRAKEAKAKAKGSNPKRGWEQAKSVAGWVKQKGETIILAVLLLLVSWQLAQTDLGLRQTEAKVEKKPTATKAATVASPSPSLGLNLGVTPVIPVSQTQATVSATRTPALPKETVAPAITSAAEGVVSEGSFPGELLGPGYCEWWNGGSQSGIWVIRSGESLYYSGYGHWWRVDSDATLDRLYPSHRDNFLASHPASREAPPTN